MDTLGSNLLCRRVDPDGLDQGGCIQSAADGIAADPGAAEYWWLYAMLLATMVPSVVNLTIGGASLSRGIPGLSRWIHSGLPADRDVPVANRDFIAAGLTAQWGLGLALAILVQGGLVWIFVQTMPRYGWGLLDIARWVETWNLPGLIFG